MNNTNLGTFTPRLQRSNAGVAYPYDITGLVSLTGSNQGAAYYYYFYDWEVAEPSYTCVSSRVPAVADITTGLSSASGLNGILIYPNPASREVTIELNSKSIVEVQLFDVAGRLIKNSTYYPGVNAKMNFDLTGVATGSYNLMVKSTEGVVVKNFQ
ncbi:MAG: T9SS type A sorting domain-containing protein [Bacteroidetes bacterium]|nr:T9SS type A sorting domain-containing protein [Bacteroidota bacterium]